MSKTDAQKLEKQRLKQNKEIARLEKEKAKPKKSYYLIYLIFIISLVYITDEIASQIAPQMKTEIANSLFAAKFGDKTVGIFDTLSMISVPFQALAIFYKPLADKLGRKMFLVINTLGMGIGLFIIFLSSNFIIYIAGYCVIQFFVPHDMQVVYIMETAPAKHRARIYSIIKCIATLGVMLIPVLRRTLMHDASQWRYVFLVPAIVGIVTSFIGLFFARETDAFIDSRLRYLRMSDEQRAAEKARKDVQNAQGGVFAALKFVFKHKQLKWLYIIGALTNMGFLIPMYYQVIMSYGYAQNYVDAGMFAEINEAALNQASLGPVTAALFLFPVGSAAVQLALGLIADAKGRKASAIAVSAVSLLAFIGFTLGSKYAWSPYLVGLFCGLSVGGFWSAGDVNVMMIGESSPTNLRSSILSAQFFSMGVGVAIAYAVGLPLISIFGNGITATVTLAVSAPGLILALVALMLKTKDTTGNNLDVITGNEYE